MPDSSWPRSYLSGFVLLALILTLSAPAEAQRDYEPLFDRFNFKAEWSWVGFDTKIGLYHEELDLGGVLHFEDDLDLGRNQSIPSLDFEWQISKRHRLAGRWQDMNRDSNAQALTEIEWGDEIIPINSNLRLSFETEQFFVDYTYYPWVKERWAAGFGLGFRIIGLTTVLSWQFEGEEIFEGSENLDVSAPLPYLYFEYRRLFSDHWRFITGLGWLDVTIEDVSGGQWIGRISCEYLLKKRWAFGLAGNAATIDVDWGNIRNDVGLGTLNGTIDLDIWDISVFGRVRF